MGGHKKTESQKAGIKRRQVIRLGAAPIAFLIPSLDVGESQEVGVSPPKLFTEGRDSFSLDTLEIGTVSI